MPTYRCHLVESGHDRRAGKWTTLHLSSRILRSSQDFSKTPRTTPVAMSRRLRNRDRKGGRRGASLRPTRAPDRRAVIAHRRRHANGRSRAQHLAADLDLDIEPTAVHVQAGVPLDDPPGGAGCGRAALSTGADLHRGVRRWRGLDNAAGAATFKYGSTRDWVRTLTVVLATGEVLDIARGDVQAHRDGYFEIEAARGTIRVPAPVYEMPRVPKCSAGYFAKPRMDLIDLFIGSEGTLGVITTVTFRLLPHPPVIGWALVPLSGDAEALALVAELRAVSQRPGGRATLVASTSAASSMWTAAASICCARMEPTRSTAWCSRRRPRSRSSCKSSWRPRR